MEQNIIERAFELASSGSCADILQLERRLKKEGYSAVNQHLSGSTLRAQLKKLFIAARQDRVPVDCDVIPSSGAMPIDSSLGQ